MVFQKTSGLTEGTINTIQLMVKENLSDQAIAERLNGLGHLTKTGKQWTNWNVGAIKSELGIRKYRLERKKQGEVRIIPPEQHPSAAEPGAKDPAQWKVEAAIQLLSVAGMPVRNKCELAAKILLS